MRRLAILTLLGACGSAAARASSPDAPRGAIDPCDVQAAAESSRRAWLGSEPVVVVDVVDNQVEIAVVSADTIIVRWVPISALGRAVITETAVSPLERSPGDPGLRLLPGFPLATRTTPWTPVHATDTVTFDGFVPSAVRGTFWIEAPSFSGSPLQVSFAVHTAPRLDAPVRAVIGPGTKVRAHRSDGRWFAITASASHAIIEGFVEEPPPAAPRPEAESSEFSDIEIDGVRTEWIPAGTCLWDAPGGRTTGAIIAPPLIRPRNAIPGWSALDVHTPWGQVTYYAHASVVEPEPPETFEWPFKSEWNGD